MVEPGLLQASQAHTSSPGSWSPNPKLPQTAAFMGAGRSHGLSFRGRRPCESNARVGWSQIQGWIRRWPHPLTTQTGDVSGMGMGLRPVESEVPNKHRSGPPCLEAHLWKTEWEWEVRTGGLLMSLASRFANMLERARSSHNSLRARPSLQPSRQLAVTSTRRGGLTSSPDGSARYEKPTKPQESAPSASRRGA